MPTAPTESEPQSTTSTNGGKVAALNNGYTPNVSTDSQGQQSATTTDESKDKKGNQNSGENAVPMNVRYSHLDDDLTDSSHKITLSNGCYRINCYIVPKFLNNVDDRFSSDVTKSLSMRLSFPNQIEKIVLEDRLDSINL